MIITFLRPDLVEDPEDIHDCFFAIQRWAQDNGFGPSVKSITSPVDPGSDAFHCSVDPPLVEPMLGVFQDQCNRLKSFSVVDGHDVFEYI